MEISKGESFPVKGGGADYSGNYFGGGWDAGDGYDLDIHVIGLKGGKPVMSHVLSWFNSPQYNGAGLLDYDAATGTFKTKDGSLVHNKDNRTGEGDGDDENVILHLDKVPTDIDELLFIVDIYEAKKNGQDFGKVKNAFVRVVQGTNPDGKETIRYNLSNDYAGKTCVQVGSLTRAAGTTWTFTAQGIGFTGTIRQVMETF